MSSGCGKVPAARYVLLVMEFDSPIAGARRRWARRTVHRFRQGVTATERGAAMVFRSHGRSGLGQNSMISLVRNQNTKSTHDCCST